MKQMFSLFLLLLCLLAASGCSSQKIVHCDRCGTEIQLDKDDKITEDWIVFCKDCETPVVS